MHVVAAVLIITATAAATVPNVVVAECGGGDNASTLAPARWRVVVPLRLGGAWCYDGVHGDGKCHRWDVDVVAQECGLLRCMHAKRRRIIGRSSLLNTAPHQLCLDLCLDTTKSLVIHMAGMRA